MHHPFSYLVCVTYLRIILLSSTTFLWDLWSAQTLDTPVRPAVLDTHGQHEQGLY
jgi:hypothetical protein